jgi:hypothetical protein
MRQGSKEFRILQLFRRRHQLGTGADVMILKIFSPKEMEKTPLAEIKLSSHSFSRTMNR